MNLLRVIVFPVIRTTMLLLDCYSVMVTMELQRSACTTKGLQTIWKRNFLENCDGQMTSLVPRLHETLSQ